MSNKHSPSNVKFSGVANSFLHFFCCGGFSVLPQENVRFHRKTIAKPLFSVSGSLSVATENRGHLVTLSSHRFG